MKVSGVCGQEVERPFKRITSRVKRFTARTWAPVCVPNPGKVCYFLISLGEDQGYKRSACAPLHYHVIVRPSDQVKQRADFLHGSCPESCRKVELKPGLPGPKVKEGN